MRGAHGSACCLELQVLFVNATLSQGENRTVSWPAQFLTKPSLSFLYFSALLLLFLKLAYNVPPSVLARESARSGGMEQPLTLYSEGCREQMKFAVL